MKKLICSYCCIFKKPGTLRKNVQYRGTAAQLGGSNKNLA
jgi:hypothetical protein